ncbi:cytochrome-c oxidase, cbb3-type subunit III [Psychromarinibacter halotolerans]|uniref:Cbb3-type cytochrome c oxidase subunit n=1 Tax=Psychromarinibacter halotolerans TaxID=1775175 RepID=A0ABV7GPC6_9RHOB|nr:cytochrome-c oxidase, cbb3-type subunit III [Psychromarinibacter halotolerans]MAQ84404.1 cytochrome-c oxidase, cbb3-type subunit III [Maritimibacter sp.]MDF0595453.1 cytochrome-c oxidase, cbb3-type subunit III [Psychromarinibacter halotolerans]
MSKKPADQPTKVDTTGHSWDGIEEYNNPLPRWWLWTFYATIVWGVIYTLLFPAWPLVERATGGFLGFSTRGQVEEQIATFEQQNAGLDSDLASVELASLADNGDLHNFAINKGAAVFRNNCSQCHGSGAQGAEGFPNLLDDDWLWGGTIDEIAYTVTNGVRNEDSFDAHWSEMPAFGRDEILTDAQITEVVQYVRQISGQDHDAALATSGEQVFAEQCAACHMDDGTGDTALGAPNLTDAIWLYGGDVASITETVTNARFGVMPAWSQEYRSAFGLTDSEINAVAAYVHQLGGGQ